MKAGVYHKNHKQQFIGICRLSALSFPNVVFSVGPVGKVWRKQQLKIR